MKKKFKSKKRLKSINASDHESSNGGLTQVSNSVIKDIRLNPQARFLYVLLSSYAWNTDYCFPSQETLANDIGITGMHIRNLLKGLEKARYIEIRRRGFENPNIYILKILPPGKKCRKRYNEVFGEREK